MRDISKVKFKNGRAYIEYTYKSGKFQGYIKREYGQIVICKNCETECFVFDKLIKKGRGKFCSSECQMQKENHPQWKGGRTKREGYIMVKDYNHPNADENNYVREHRLIIEKQIGRYLHSKESVHHINEIKDDNRPANLIAFKNHSIHRRFENGYPINSQDIIFDGRKLPNAKKGEKTR